MATIKGRIGALFAPNSSSISLSGGTFGITESGTSGIYSITTLATRIAFTLASGAVVTDFTANAPHSGNPTAIRHAVAEFDLGPADSADKITDSTGGNIIGLSKAGGFFDWSVQVNMSNAETTQFGNTWTTRVTTLKNWSGSASAYWTDENFTLDVAAGLVAIDGETVAGGGASNNEAPFTIAFFLDNLNASTPQRFVGQAVVTGFEISDSVGGVVEKTVNFEGNGPLYYRSSDLVG